MGWKVSSIIVNPKTDIKYEVVLGGLGFSNFTKVADDSYDIAICPDHDKIYMGSYKDNLIICADTLPIAFFDKSLSDIERKFIGLFPNSEICALSLQSAINHFGFALIKDGQKLRAKSGDAELGTVVDYGEPLEQELELLAESSLNESGERLYYLSKYSGEPFRDHQVGENFVFEIFKRYTGKLLDEDDDLMNTSFSCYQLRKDTFSPEKYFTGEWVGEYSYGDGYKEITKGKTVRFALGMTIVNDALNGYCIDENKQFDTPAKIHGFIVDKFIGFVKEYPVNYVLDKNGAPQIGEFSPPTSVEYSGLYDSITDSFKGIWRIENKQFWGTWTMKRK